MFLFKVRGFEKRFVRGGAADDDETEDLGQVQGVEGADREEDGEGGAHGRGRERLRLRAAEGGSGRGHVEEERGG